MAYEQSKLFTLPLSEPVVERTFSPDLKGLIAWLETQDGATQYEYFCADMCLFGKFHAAIGIPTGYFGGTRHGPNLEKMYSAEACPVAAGLPHTYGAALTRARIALANPP